MFTSQLYYFNAFKFLKKGGSRNGQISTIKPKYSRG